MIHYHWLPRFTVANKCRERKEGKSLIGGDRKSAQLRKDMCLSDFFWRAKFKCSGLSRISGIPSIRLIMSVIYDVKEGSQRKYISRSIYVIDLSNLTQAFEYHSGTRNEMRMDKVI